MNYQKNKEAPRLMTTSASHSIEHMNADIEQRNSVFLAADKIINLEAFLAALKIKVQKENKRFNVETVVANYRFGTWNIGTVKGKSGEVCEVLRRRRKVKVCCIQEVRWKGEGSRALQGYKLIWKGNSEETAGVVGVLVASELADRIIRVERISDRSHCC